MPNPLTHRLGGRGNALLVDAASWLAGMTIGVASRYDFDPTHQALADATTVALLAVSLHAIIGHTRYLYRGRHQPGTFDEVRAVATTVVMTTVLVTAVDLIYPVRLVPASSPVVGGVVALMLMLGARYTYRFARDRALQSPAGSPALLFGAGEAGHFLVQAIRHDRRSPYRPVGMLDDDPDKCHLRVHGVPVLGTRADLATVARRTGASTVVFAVANADAGLIREIRRTTLEAGLTFKVIPSVAELLDGRTTVTDIRDADVGDLLGRRQIETDLASIAGYLAGKRVLVTGAGGSIGAELCRQLQLHHPSELMMLDRDESGLHGVQLALRGRALLDTPELILADLRDAEAIAEVFATRRPQVVFHAAALKHLPLLERFPGEAVKTNVWGTLNVLAAAAGVERFVNISTDKAANPSSVLGYSKRITERLAAHASTVNAGVFLNVRFGNVLGSRGSVMTAFAAQVAAGGPLTVTHPEVTRYLMTVQEAVQLVIQAGAIGRDGEALVLDIGSPARVADLARQLAEQSTTPVQIVYTGLRPGEKLHEELLAPDERGTRPLHPLISHVSVPPLHPAAVRRLDPNRDRADVVSDLAALCRVETAVVRQLPH